MDDIKIRRCTPKDTTAIASLGARLFVEAYGPTHPEPDRTPYLAYAYSDREIGAAIEEEGGGVLVAEEGSELIGYVHLRPSPNPPEGVKGNRPYEIVRFYVAASHQGKGIGRALMDRACDEAKSGGGDVIWLQVWSEADWAVAFYHKVGYEIVGKAPFHFGKRIDRDHVMARAL
ncbi:MAG TPA: N-acetyltransferase [Gemmatimonadaceae bacterium]|nr:N-acetyltransferase [Gemmatimonadaceae bacterium]